MCIRDSYVDLEEGDFSLKGELRYGPFTRLESDIMGPFRRVPARGCVHTVLSMAHPLEGLLCLNGRYLDFSHGTGYIEGDRGRSFPRTYLWTQCCWQERQKGSIMLSICLLYTSNTPARPSVWTYPNIS